MKLEDQVVSLELAKKMKELGFEQESHFCWHNVKSLGGYGVYPFNEYRKLHNEDGTEKNYSAYTVAELGEMLPIYTTVTKSKSGYMVMVDLDDSGETVTSSDKLEANARAKMLIYLKENNLLEDNTL